jgi:hypothetical protein
MGLAEQAPDNMTSSINSTYLKAHRTAFSLRLKEKGGGEGRLIGLTKGGMTTKLHAITPSHGLQANHCRAMDISGRPIRLFITAGQVRDYTGAAALMNELPEAEWLLAPSHRNYVSTAGQWTEGIDADWLREALIDKGTKPCIAGQWIRDATSDATVSRDSRTGGGARHAMTDHQPYSSRQSHALQPS